MTDDLIFNVTFYYYAMISWGGFRNSEVAEGVTAVFHQNQPFHLPPLHTSHRQTHTHNSHFTAVYGSIQYFH